MWTIRRDISMFFLVLQLATASLAFAESYSGLSELDPKQCVPADDSVLSRLPPTWKKYGDFVKVCNLRRDGKNSDVSIISVWEQEYFRHVQQLGKVPHLEPFPLPVIVNKLLIQIGTLPEVYPVDDITSPVIYYGKWRNFIPTEILVDVENPAEGGDYHYEPIVYNWSKGRYQIRNKEIINGRRR